MRTFNSFRPFTHVACAISLLTLAGCGAKMTPSNPLQSANVGLVRAHATAEAPIAIAEILIFFEYLPMFDRAKVVITASRGGSPVSIEILNLNGELGNGHEVQVTARVDGKVTPPSQVADLVRNATLAEGIGESDRKHVLALLKPVAPTR